jgi:ferredoxin
MTLVSAGINDIRLVHADCERCPNKTGWSTVCEVNSSIKMLLVAWERDSQVALTHDMPPELQMSTELAQKTEDVSGLSRRDFFAQFKTGAKSFVAGAAASVTGVAAATTAEQTILPKVMTDGTLPHFIPHRRETLLNCLCCLGDPVAERINTRLWGQMTIDTDACNSCRMCATFCPTGAITKFDGSDGSIGVEHYSAHCVQCRLCEDVCTVDALKISSDVELHYFVEGKSKQFTMKPLTRRIGKPDSIYTTMYDLLGGGQIYER